MLERLGEFTLQEKLGEGGMGSVYLAYQESLDRYVALKVLTERLCRNEKFIARFKREARSAASIVHPNVIQIYSIGEEEGIHYFAMEYVKGKDLTVHFSEGRRFEPEEVVDLVSQVAEALQSAGEVGIVHRDIKPANIMLTDRGRVKVTDFGLAKSMTEDLDVTEAGTIVGTANYMSPEQGQGKTLDVRSDIYSLGVVFFELLAGRPPFVADQASAVLYMHIYEPAPPPGRFNPEVPAAVDKMVLRMLEKDPADRPQDPTALLEELRGLRQSLGYTPSAPGTDTAVRRLEENALRRREASTASARAPDSVAHPASVAEEKEAAPARGLTALVADDVPPVRILYRRVLNDMGFRVVEAGDGEEALSHWRENRPDLVLLDLSMPRMGGLEALEEIRREGLGGEVIVISAHKERETIVEAAHRGVTAYLTKPVNIDELRARVGQVLRLPHKQEAFAEAKARRADGDEAPAPAPAAPPSKLLLVYSPTPYARNLFRSAAEGGAVQVVCVERTGEVKKILADDPPEALAVDAGRADEEAMPLIEACRHRHPGLPLLAVVDEGDEARAEELRAMGVEAVLPRPVRLDKVDAALEEVLAGAPEEPQHRPEGELSRVLERQMVKDHAFTVFDFARTLAGALPPGARESFEKRVQEGKPRELTNAIHNLLKRLRSEGRAEEAMRYLRHAYLNGNVEVRNLCLTLIPELVERKEEVEILQKIVTDEDFRIRCRILNRLGELRAEEAAPLVVRFLHDDVWKVRKTAAACLEHFPLATTIEPLLTFYARSREPLPDRIRMMLLRNAGAREIEALERLVRDGDAETKAFVARFLGDLRSKLSVRLLTKLLTDKSARVRIAAAEAAGRIHNDKLHEALREALTDANSEVQAAVVQALRSYRSTPAAAVYLEALAARRKRINADATRFYALLDRGENVLAQMLQSIGSQNPSNRRHLSLFLGHLYPEADRLNEVVRLLNAAEAAHRQQGVRRVVGDVTEAARALSRASSTRGG